MSVTINIPTALRQFTAGNSRIEVEAATAGEALDRLTSQHTELRRHLYDDKNALRSFVNVYVNDEDVRHQSGGDTPLKDGDTVMIVPSIAGGATTEAEVAPALPSLSNEEIARYSRHLIMPEVGSGRAAAFESCQRADDRHRWIGRARRNVSRSRRRRTPRHCRLRCCRSFEPSAPDHSWHCGYWPAED